MNGAISTPIGANMATVFYSWQSDIAETRGLVQAALERAVRNVNRDYSLEMRLDQDTSGIGGWPEIAAVILDKIDQCEVFVADITPINGPESNFRLTPNPNVMLELGYALATGLGRTRIICIVNSAYLLNEEIKELPFDIRGSRPLVFSLADRGARGVKLGQEDPIRSQTREDLTKRLERALNQTFEAIREERVARMIDVTPHLVSDDLKNFRVLLRVGSPAPFQMDFLIREPSGNVLSPIMMSPHRVDPQNATSVRFQETTFKPLTPGNKKYILSGKVAHVPTDEKPVPQFHSFQVTYSVVGGRLSEISRVPIPVH